MAPQRGMDVVSGDMRELRAHQERKVAQEASSMTRYRPGQSYKVTAFRLVGMPQEFIDWRKSSGWPMAGIVEVGGEIWIASDVQALMQRGGAWVQCLGVIPW